MIKNDYTVITTRARAFRPFGVQEIQAIVDDAGFIRVYDDIAGYYTRCHSLGKSAQRRIRTLVKESELNA